MVVSTGASGYIKYAYEGDTFGTVAGGAQTLTTNTGKKFGLQDRICLLYTSPSPRDKRQSRMPSSA